MYVLNERNFEKFNQKLIIWNFCHVKRVKILKIEKKKLNLERNLVIKWFDIGFSRIGKWIYSSKLIEFNTKKSQIQFL